MSGREDTHSLAVGYVLWIFGFTGAHRFYFGKPISGTLYLLTAGFFLIGWIIDLFLMPRLERSAELRFKEGPLDYTIGWVLLTFVGVFGIHRFYLGKWFTGLLYLLTGGLLLVGIVYDFWTLNDQISETNAQAC